MPRRCRGVLVTLLETNVKVETPPPPAFGCPTFRAFRKVGPADRNRTPRSWVAQMVHRCDPDQPRDHLNLQLAPNSKRPFRGVCGRCTEDRSVSGALRRKLY